MKGNCILASRLGLLTIVSLVVVSLTGVVLADADSAPPQRPVSHLLLVPQTPAGVIALAQSDARVVARYKSFSLVETSDDAPLRAAGADRRDDMRDVVTAAGDVDPAERASLAGKDAPDRDEVLALVQFVGPPKDAWLERLRATGALIVTYQAENAYVVHARGAAVDRLSGLVGTDPAVRAVAPLEAVDKVEGAAEAAARYAVSTIAGAVGSDAREAADAEGRAVGAATTMRGLRTQYLELSPSGVAALARDPAVVAIERDAPPTPADERADQIVAGNLTPPALTQPSGATYLAWHDAHITAPFDATIDVTDSGLDNGASPSDHPDFHVSGVPSNPDRIAYGIDYSSSGGTTNDCTGHGTSAASIAAGYNASSGSNSEDGSGFNYGLGVAPLAQIGVSRIFDCAGAIPVPGFTPETVASNAFAGGATISNNSWGTGGTDFWGSYSSRARTYDGLVRDAQSGAAGNQQMLEVFSAGNDGGVGEDTVAAEGSAKNVITVGASEGVRPSGTDGCNVPNTSADNARQIAAFSSRGPTDDGRLKPDLVAPGSHITGARPVGGSYTGLGTCNGFFTSAYSLASGTSQAAPQVAGAAALVRDWYEDTESTVPSPALTKALLINTASDLAAGPDNQQGWGRVNAGAALDATTSREYYDQLPGDVLGTPGQTVVRSFTVPSSTKPVKVTLAWTDAVGPPMGNAFVNDLDLQVAAGGKTYKGNVFGGAWSRPGGSADPRDNVENVYLPAGISGGFSVTVRATSLTGDGLPGNVDLTDQDFALVVSNATEQAAPVLVHAATTVTGGDGDGVLESDEQVGLTEQLRNSGNADATGLSATLTGGSGLGVSQGSSTYPDIADDEGVAANNSPFTAKLANAATCGAHASATLSVATGSGTQTVPLVLPTGAPGALQTNPSSEVPTTIPDNSATGVSSSVFVAERGRIKDLNVTLPTPGILHPSDGDLVIDIIGPDGTSVRLADHVRGPDYAGHSFSGTTFDDEAIKNISEGAAPFTGNFRPQNDQLSRFDGKSRRGTWTLRVRDLFAGDVGTLRAWGVASQKARCNVDTTAPGTVIGAGPRNPTTSRSAQFSIGSNDATAIFECRLDFSAWAPCGKSVTYSDLAVGAHSFAARAIDGSDNEDPSPATYNWTVTEPAASFVVGPVEERLSTAVSGHYRVLAACASACRASAKLTLRVGRRTVTLGSAAKRRKSAGTATVAVRLGKRGRAALRGRKLARAKLTATLTMGGAKLTLKRAVSLRRGAGLARIASRGLRLWAAATRRSPLSGSLSLSAAEARRIDLKPGQRKRLTVAAGSTTASRTPKVLTLKLGRRARLAFSHARRVGALLEAVAGEAPEPLRTAKLSKTLRR